MDALKSFIDISRTEFDKYADGIDCESVKAAAELIIDAKKKGGRLHITGIGKPAHIAGYAASLISSTGTPAYFLHGTEAVHGSCGQLAEGDVVICISNSGETAELKATAMAIKNNGCKIISVTGNPDSWLLYPCRDLYLTVSVGRITGIGQYYSGGICKKASRRLARAAERKRKAELILCLQQDL